MGLPSYKDFEEKIKDIKIIVKPRNTKHRGYGFACVIFFWLIGLNWIPLTLQYVYILLITIFGLSIYYGVRYCFINWFAKLPKDSLVSKEYLKEIYESYRWIIPRVDPMYKIITKMDGIPECCKTAIKEVGTLEILTHPPKKIVIDPDWLVSIDYEKTKDPLWFEGYYFQWDDVLRWHTDKGVPPFFTRNGELVGNISLIEKLWRDAGIYCHGTTEAGDYYCYDGVIGAKPRKYIKRDWSINGLEKHLEEQDEMNLKRLDEGYYFDWGAGIWRRKLEQEENKELR